MKEHTLDRIAIDTIRMLSIDAIEKARSGHPGAPLGAAPMAYVLWSRHLRFNPLNPRWLNRDRFILSMGHASMLLYALLFIFGFPITLDDIKRFRQLGSVTAGHPEYNPDLGIETTTGPLGQGFGNAVGMALAEAHLSARFNRENYPIIDHYTYVMASDGDIMEGISHESASLAGHLKLGKLIVLYDSNNITIEGSTSLTFSEDVEKRFESYGWHVQVVEDGNDLEALDNALVQAKAQSRAPSLIIVRTHIGYGSPKQDSESSHGAPLGPDAVRMTKEFFGWPVEPEFYVPKAIEQIQERYRQRGKELEEEWNRMYQAWSEAYPEARRELEDSLLLKADGVLDDFSFGYEPEVHVATRTASGQILNVVAEKLSYVIGGSADLGPSNKTLIQTSGDLLASKYHERNIHFGIREHAMGAMINGMMLHGGLRPYAGTFLVFSDYMRPSIRLAALMKLPVLYIFTHDSICVGEDGPTHQPIEQLMSLRLIPGLIVIRPADAYETLEAWKFILTYREGPVALILTRQNVPVLGDEYVKRTRDVSRGAYILSEARGEEPVVILVATGSEVHLALSAQKALEETGYPTRVVSMPSWELFYRQPKEYQLDILPPHVPVRIAIEGGVTQGWERWVGANGKCIGIDRFGASAPWKDVYAFFGFTVDHVVETARECLKEFGIQ